MSVHTLQVIPLTKLCQILWENTLSINVIDLFAGSGGLGEGFLSFQSEFKDYPFKAICSVEKDINAHATLRLRSFFRKLKEHRIEIPVEYYNYAKGLAESPSNEATNSLWEEASLESICLTLGADEAYDTQLFKAIKKKYASILKANSTVLIGGPPCQAYSIVGRARNKGNRDYVPELDARHFLYKEYLKIVQMFSPDIFVMENVKGLLSSQVGGGPVFTKIIEDLHNCGEGYTLFSLKTGNRFFIGHSNPNELVLRSESYGVPQCRHRIIILGVKNSLANKMINIPTLQKSEQVSVRDAISDLPFCRSYFSSRSKFFISNSLEEWKFNLTSQLMKLIDEEKDLDLVIVEALKAELCTLGAIVDEEQKKHFFSYPLNDSLYHRFVYDSSENEIISHEPRPHMDSDLVRYFFCSVFRKVKGRNPTVIDFPQSLAANHKSWNSGKFVDRFKVQGLDAPSSTITSHISKDGHYFIHPDPTQCRSLTVREAARLQSFPDSYVFMGKRTNQFHQIGNAVPPLLARQIASIVYEILESSK